MDVASPHVRFTLFKDEIHVLEVDTSTLEVDTSTLEVDTSTLEIDTSTLEVDTSTSPEQPWRFEVICRSFLILLFARRLLTCPCTLYVSWPAGRPGRFEYVAVV